MDLRPGAVVGATGLAEGRAVSAILAQEGRLDPRRTVTIVAGAAEALATAHASRSCTPNLTSACLFVDAEDRVQLADVGVTTLTRRIRPGLRGVGRRAGVGEAPGRPLERCRARPGRPELRGPVGQLTDAGRPGRPASSKVRSG